MSKHVLIMYGIASFVIIIFLLSVLLHTIKRDDLNQRNNSRQEKKHWLDYAAFIIATVAVIIAGAVGFYQGYIARETMIIGNRALVISNTIKFFSYDDPNNPHRKWLVSAIFENVGNSPTKYLRYSSRTLICFNEYLDKFDNYFPRDISNHTIHIIGPKSEIDTDVFRAVGQFSGCKVTIVSLGFIVYDDIFYYPHITEYCNYIESIEDFKKYPIGQSVRVPARPCQDHNCTDEECGTDWRERAEGKNILPNTNTRSP